MEKKLDHYELAFDISPVPMVLVSTKGEIVLSNALFDELFEYETGSLLGRNVEILVPDSIRGSHPELRGEYFKVPVKRKMGEGRDLHGITKNGQIVSLELSLDAVTIGEQRYAMLVALDVRQRNLHGQRMNIAMNASASAMIMIDELGEIVFVNLSALKLFGYKENELIGSPVERLVPKEIKDVHPGYRSGFVRAGKSRSMAAERDLFAIHKQGNQIPVEIALTHVETPMGKMVVSTIIDLTERVSAERAMERKNAELEVLNQELKQFAFSASHDLKAPLSTMVGLLDLCMEDWDDGSLSTMRNDISNISDIGRRCVSKVEDVLKIALAADNASIPAEPADLQAIVQDMWLDLAGNNEDGVALELQLHHEDPIVLEVPTLKVILENLISNAIRYCDRDKAIRTITIHSECRNGHLVVSVVDNGIGIPAEGQDNVFTMFKRIDERSENGLGLVLVKKQIDRLSGAVDFTSMVGQGTTFTVSLPLVVAA